MQCRRQKQATTGVALRIVSTALGTSTSTLVAPTAPARIITTLLGRL